MNPIGKSAHSSMDRIADSGSADGGSNPSGHTKKPAIYKIAGFLHFNLKVLNQVPPRVNNTINRTNNQLIINL